MLLIQEVSRRKERGERSMADGPGGWLSHDQCQVSCILPKTTNTLLDMAKTRVMKTMKAFLIHSWLAISMAPTASMRYAQNSKSVSLSSLIGYGGIPLKCSSSTDESSRDIPELPHERIRFVLSYVACSNLSCSLRCAHGVDTKGYPSPNYRVRESQQMRVTKGEI